MTEVQWNIYPKSMPPRDGYYLVTMYNDTETRKVVRSRYFDANNRCFYYDPKGDRRVLAWAELPPPYGTFQYDTAP